MVSAPLLISKSSSPFTMLLGIVSSAPITLGITVNFMFNCCCFLVWPRKPGFNPRSSHTKDLKNGTCKTLSIIRYVSRVKWSNTGESACGV